MEETFSGFLNNLPLKMRWMHSSFALWVIFGLIAILVLYRNSLTGSWQQLRKSPMEWFRDLWKNWGEPFLVALILAVVIRIFLFAPYKIPSGSMIPTLMIGDRIFVDKVSYRFKEPQR